ncbi:hypothetical protein BaRGS_00020926 [Batillaria attramentaria]|uniref:Uncharacterized protein n=1 Tax=Batillaria attramentaria TaxID=370345 RepID=A0ABD0KL87_9CAEN
MLRCAIAALLLATALSLDYEAEWSEFKKVYRKSYAPKEEPIRRAIWEANLNLIQQHNLEADRGVHSYWLGMNQLGDMTAEEVTETMNGLKVDPNRKPGETFMPPSNMGPEPKKVDWRTKGYVTPVKNQERCGSCWAFSATGSLEGQHFKKTGKLVSLSEQNLVDCSQKEGNHGCGGGLMDYAFRYIEINNGIDTEESYPYIGKSGLCRFLPQDVGATDVGYVDIKRFNEKALQKAVATVGPISIGIDASRPTFHLYKTGVYYDPKCNSTRLDHGVLAVGYGEENGEKYWLVKNSWGEEWGMQGYIKMAKDRDNACGVATQASYPRV